MPTSVESFMTPIAVLELEKKLAMPAKARICNQRPSGTLLCPETVGHVCKLDAPTRRRVARELVACQNHVTNGGVHAATAMFYLDSTTTPESGFVLSV